MELLQLGQARIMLRIVIISSVELQQSSYTGIVAVGQLLINSEYQWDPSKKSESISAENGKEDRLK